MVVLGPTPSPAGAAALLLALAALAHAGAMAYRYGLVNAWRKSVARKGSWTASIEHFRAMLLKEVVARDTRLTPRAKGRRLRNVWGGYAMRTGERHDAAGKAELRRKWHADS